MDYLNWKLHFEMRQLLWQLHQWLTSHYQTRFFIHALALHCVEASHISPRWIPRIYAYFIRLLWCICLSYMSELNIYNGISINARIGIGSRPIKNVEIQKPDFFLFFTQVFSTECTRGKINIENSYFQCFHHLYENFH